MKDKMILSKELVWRGFFHQTTFKNDDISALDKKPITFYWGVDPSSNSMTIGNLATAMMVKTFIKHGHKAYLLVGGATGIIGDPDGKTEERELNAYQRISHNSGAIVAQYERIFDGDKFKIVNNNRWFRNIRYINFLNEIGKHVPMREMLGRDFVETRLNDRTKHINYAEFSYALIQAYDFYHLFKRYGVTLQVCGSDQWGNSIAGVKLIRRKLGKDAHILSAPLIVNKATGQKFGKSESGAIWLDPEKTSIYKFYQYWLNVDDDSVKDYLKIFTQLSKQEVEGILTEFKSNKGKRLAQKRLAFEVTKIVHGLEAAQSQKRIAAVLFGGEDALELTTEDFNTLAKELPTVRVSKGKRHDLLTILVKAELAASKSEARRFINGGAIYINNRKMPSDFRFDSSSANAVMVRRGKNVNAILKLV